MPMPMTQKLMVAAQEDELAYSRRLVRRLLGDIERIMDAPVDDKVPIKDRLLGKDSVKDALVDITVLLMKLRDPQAPPPEASPAEPITDGEWQWMQHYLKRHESSGTDESPGSD